MSDHLEKTIALIKPDAVGKGLTSEILKKIRSLGYTILRDETVHMTRDQAGAFYEEHKGKSFYEKLITFMTSGPSRVLVLSKTNAIQDWRDHLTSGLRLEFAEDPENPGSVHPTYNALHGSSDPEAAKRELKFWFNSMTVDDIPSSGEARDYVDKNLKPILVKALTELVKSKPENQIKWLSQYLLANNPNKPTIQMTKLG
ncbi:Nucleoside diphosphate kinase [Diplonema papillatum]|nr:Nucleoside diphosphate kinase [Diplonema papillatum]